MYTAEGIDADRVDAPAFETRYARMDPFAAKALRKLKCGHYTDTSSASPNVSSEKYSYVGSTCMHSSSIECILDRNLS